MFSLTTSAHQQRFFHDLWRFKKSTPLAKAGQSPSCTSAAAHLSHGREYISIREETEHVRNYLYIQRFRHGDKYDYRLDVQEDILAYKTLKLI